MSICVHFPDSITDFLAEWLKATLAIFSECPLFAVVSVPAQSDHIHF